MTIPVSAATQPRLPDDVGEVRDREVTHPQFVLPKADPNDFELTAESGAGQTLDLFADGDRQS